MFHTIVNANSIAQHVIQIKNEIMKHANANVKTIKQTKKITVGILIHVFVRKEKYLGSTADDSVITCDEIINARDSISNVTSTASKDFYDKK